MQSWYLLYTKPKCEEMVARQLTDAGLEVFSPKVKERKYVRRKVRDAVTHLFPCYVFVRFDLTRGYRMVRYTRGVRRVVGTENVPTVVPDAIVEAIHAREIDGVVSPEPPVLEAGTDVYIKGGPLEGLDAVFMGEINGMARVSILLKAINSRVVIDGALLARADSA